MPGHQREPARRRDDPGRGPLPDLGRSRRLRAILDRAVGASQSGRAPSPSTTVCSADHEVMHHDFPYCGVFYRRHAILYLARPDGVHYYAALDASIPLDQTRDGSTAISGFDTRLPSGKGKRNRANRRDPRKGRCRRSRRGPTEKNQVGAVVAAAKRCCASCMVFGSGP